MHGPRAAMAAIHHDMIHGFLLSTRISGFQRERGEEEEKTTHAEKPYVYL